MAYRSSNTNHASSGTSVVVTKPSGTVDNDWLVMVISNDYNSATASVASWPSGFTEVFQLEQSADHWLSVAIKKAASEGASYTATLNGTNGGWCAAVLAYSGCAASQPDASGSNLGGGYSASPVSVSANAITVVAASDLIFVGAANFSTGQGSAETWAPPSGMTERADVAEDYATLCVADKSVAAGSTGGITGTLTLASGTASPLAGLISLALETATHGSAFGNGAAFNGGKAFSGAMA
jgi:hypothetical protein